MHKDQCPLVTGETINRASALVRDKISGNKRLEEEILGSFLEFGVITGGTTNAIHRLIGDEMGMDKTVIAKNAKLILESVSQA